jgi:predicted aconitase with swiveling domain
MDIRMKKQTINLEANVLIAGSANGPAMVLDDTLSFWGGFNPGNGEIIDVHHPQYKQLVGGSILCIPRSKGSAGTPGGIAETLRNGSGPLAFIIGERDVNISVGTLVANRLYELDIPVLEVSLSEMKRIRSGDQLAIDRQGLLSITTQA